MTPNHRTGEQIQAETLARLNRESARAGAAAPADVLTDAQQVLRLSGVVKRPHHALIRLAHAVVDLSAQLAARDAALQELQKVAGHWESVAHSADKMLFERGTRLEHVERALSDTVQALQALLRHAHEQVTVAQHPTWRQGCSWLLDQLDELELQRVARLRASPAPQAPPPVNEPHV